MGWQQTATKTIQQAAKSDTSKQAGKAVRVAAIATGSKVGSDAVREWFNERRERGKRKRAESTTQQEARDKATAMALSLKEGRYSERTVIANEYRYVVWVGEEPRAVFPPLDPSAYKNSLSDHPELRDFDRSRLIDPRRPDA
jgi:hypothetical protein